MWPYDLLPLQLLKERYGFEPSAEWIERLKYGSVRIDAGGSGSFASAHGLVATNHHVAMSALRQISREGKDFVKDGFTAQSLGEEIPIPDYSMSVLAGIEDVTEQIHSAVTDEMSPYQAVRARDRKIAEIESKIFEETGQKVEVVNYFNGSFYHLYRYHRYDDVRLVFAPEYQAGFFGGDEANFNYPRHVLDEAFFRIYENGRPLEVKHYIPWSEFGSQEEELLFVSGHPGSTQRYLSSAELLFEKEVRVPMILDILESRVAALKSYSGQSEEAQRQAKPLIFSLENGLKVYRAMAATLDAGVIEERHAEEKTLRESVSESRKEDVESAQSLIQEGVEKMKNAYGELVASGSLAIDSKLYEMASKIVRYHLEMKLDNLDRRSAYREANLDQLFRGLYNEEPIYPELEKVKLENSMNWLVEYAGTDSSITQIILGIDSLVPLGDAKERKALIKKRAADLVDQSEMFDAAKRKALIEGDEKALENSKDPMIQLARKVLPMADQVNENMINQMGSLINAGHRQLFQIRFDRGEELAPDATFTLRLSFGQVKGYTEFGVPLAPYTTMGQMFDQAEARENKGDWQLPQSWQEAMENGRIDPTVPMNFVSLHDTTGGNSGSPVVNSRGEKVGILFDGNRHGVGQDKFQMPAKLNRSVSVDCRATLAALRGIYPGEGLVRELKGAAPYSQ